MSYMVAETKVNPTIAFMMVIHGCSEGDNTIGNMTESLTSSSLVAKSPSVVCACHLAMVPPLADVSNFTWKVDLFDASSSSIALENFNASKSPWQDLGKQVGVVDCGLE
ncbi:hypothetical protein ACH5RR_031409 [Cinchona calisaya]|uniref:Uncharacterized protein n=1 Tax=Cinchona calisaya TaxID=153742 RepID=A0ABD2YJK6_9GENT